MRACEETLCPAALGHGDLAGEAAEVERLALDDLLGTRTLSYTLLGRSSRAQLCPVETARVGEDTAGDGAQGRGWWALCLGERTSVRYIRKH